MREQEQMLMPWLCRFWHAWTKWTTVTLGNGEAEPVQERTCLRCAFVQRRGGFVRW